MTRSRLLCAASTALFLCGVAPGCVHGGPRGGALEDEPRGRSDAEVVVASIDPPLPAAGPELRQARVELARTGAGESPLAGLVAVALTGDPGAVEILVRGLGEADSCVDAATAVTFLPRQQAPTRRAEPRASP